MSGVNSLTLHIHMVGGVCIEVKGVDSYKFNYDTGTGKCNGYDIKYVDARSKNRTVVFLDMGNILAVEREIQ